MDVESKVVSRPKILNLTGGIIVGLGFLFVPLGVVVTILKYLEEDGDFFTALNSLYEFIGTGFGICGFGLAIIRGRRWHLFSLLLLVFFGSLVIGLFSMVGEETNVGYYIWAIGGIVSIMLIAVLFKYWDKLLDG